MGRTLNLKEIIDRLLEEDPDTLLSVGWDEEDSYRGFYEELCVIRAENVTIATMIACLRRAIGNTYGGYKGGLFIMSEQSNVYLVHEYNEGFSEQIGVDMLDLMIRGKENERTY